MKKRARPWLVVVGAFLILFTTVGLGTNGISLFYKPVAEGLGFNQTKFNLYFTIYKLAMMVATPFAGKLLSKKFQKIRIYMLIGGVINMAGLIGYSFCKDLMAFYVISAIRGAASALIYLTTATMFINNWFVKKRSTIMSLVYIGTSAGGLFYTQLSRILISSFGWQKAYFCLGIVSFITVLIAVVLTSPSPEAEGTLPYGYDAGMKTSGAEEKVNDGVMMGQALKSAPFWLLCVAMFIGAVAVMGVQQCAASALQLDFGHSDVTAANIVSVFMLFICIGKPILGAIFDKIGIKVGLVYSYLMLALAVVFLLMSQDIALAYVFAVLFGLGNMSVSLVASTTTVDIFGTRDYGTIYSVVTMFLTGGISVGPIISGAIYDSTGSYTMAWYLYIALSFVTLVLLLVALRASKRLAHSQMDS